ncbi:MAG: aldehyde ferredoxin oxidoreductase C-terminal domain-containing protein, partial [Anaerolineae bacterium]
GVLETVELESLGPEKVRASLYHSIREIVGNCVPICLFTGWSLTDLAVMVQAATGWNMTDHELYKVGERAWTLARVFNAREGFTPEDDTLCPRSFGPTTSGALQEGGIDMEELREAMHTYYAMAGWDPETGVPTPAKLHELDVAWAIEYLPG